MSLNFRCLEQLSHQVTSVTGHYPALIEANVDVATAGLQAKEAAQTETAHSMTQKLL